MMVLPPTEVLKEEDGWEEAENGEGERRVLKEDGEEAEKGERKGENTEEGRWGGG